MSTCDWPRFEAWFAVERQRRHSVPGFEHAMFFEWLRLGQPAASAAAEAPVASAALPPPAPAPAPRPARPAAPRSPRPAPQRQQRPEPGLLF
ncbi:MAG: hypothetical protein EPO40_06190 [Myxococcaceae bacterium]|nr:MAG: hypothetical protein EPO40_06190 [Myxococcaceae bacterium]